MADKVTVTFNPDEFRAMFKPHFDDTDKYTDEFLQFCFELAVLLIGNCPLCEIKHTSQKYYLYLATAHIAFRMAYDPNISGILSSASEGSVSASFSITDSNNAGFWNSTQWGRMLWELVRPKGGKFFTVIRPRCRPRGDFPG